MSLSALLLVLAAAVVHGTWNVIAKRVAGGDAYVFLYTLGGAIVYAPAVLWLLFVERIPLDAVTLGAVAVSAVLHLVYGVVLQRGYQVGDLSVVYPVARGTGPLIATAGAILLLGERPSPLALGGAALIVAGTFLVAGGANMLRTGAVHRGVGHGVLTGIFISTYTLWDAYSVKILLIAPVLLQCLSYWPRTVFFLPVAWRNRAEVRRLWRDYRWEVVASAVLAPLAYILVLVAMKIAPVSYVAPARELSMLFAAFLGARLLKEGEMKTRMLASGLIVLGVVALAAG